MPVAAPETELPFGETAITEGILFYPNHHFSFPSYKSCFNTCMTFADVVATNEGEPQISLR